MVCSQNNSLANSLKLLGTIPSNGSLSFSIDGVTRALVCTFGFGNEVTQIYIVTSTSGGAIYARPITTSTGLSMTTSGSTMTLTNSTASNAYAGAIVLNGSVGS